MRREPTRYPHQKLEPFDETDPVALAIRNLVAAQNELTKAYSAEVEETPDALDVDTAKAARAAAAVKLLTSFETEDGDDYSDCA